MDQRAAHPQTQLTLKPSSPSFPPASPLLAWQVPLILIFMAREWGRPLSRRVPQRHLLGNYLSTLVGKGGETRDRAETRALPPSLQTASRCRAVRFP